MPISHSNMLLSASSSFLNLGVRPRAVTTPVRIRNPSGTWGGMSTTNKDLCPNPRPRPIQTTHQAALATHHFSTIHAARVRKCGLLDWTLHDEREADDLGSYHGTSQHVAHACRCSPHLRRLSCLVMHWYADKQNVAHPSPSPQCSLFEPSRPRRCCPWPPCPQAVQVITT